MFLCAVMGVVNFSMLMTWQNSRIEQEINQPNQSVKEVLLARVAYLRYLTASHVFNPVFTLCVIHSINFLLLRVSDHVSHPYYNTVRDRNHDQDDNIKRFDCRDCVGEYALYYWARTMRVIALVICSLCIAAGVVAAGFRAGLIMYLDRAAAGASCEGNVSTSPGFEEWREIREGSSSVDMNANVSFVAALALEAAAYVLEISGFLLFFPAVIVMFGRISRKMDALLKEMNLRSDHGTAFLPLEFSPQAADGSETQTEMQIVEVRQYMRAIQSSAAAQQKRFVLCLLLFTTSLAFLASQSVFVAVILFNADGYNQACERCGACQSDVFLMLSWYANASFLH